jgi:MFS family permease
VLDDSDLREQIKLSVARANGDDSPMSGITDQPPGALVGTLAFSVVGHRLPRRFTFLACMLVAPVVMFGSLAATPPLAALLAALAVSGVVFGPMNSLFATAIQETTPTDLLGRVIGTVSALSMVGVPLGATVVGLVVARWDWSPHSSEWVASTWLSRSPWPPTRPSVQWTCVGSRRDKASTWKAEAAFKMSLAAQLRFTPDRADASLVRPNERQP